MAIVKRKSKTDNRKVIKIPTKSGPVVKKSLILTGKVIKRKDHDASKVERESVLKSGRTFLVLRETITESDRTLLKIIFKKHFDITFLQKKDAAKALVDLLAQLLPLTPAVLQHFVKTEIADIVTESPRLFPTPRVMFHVFDHIGLFFDKKEDRAHAAQLAGITFNI